MRGRLAPHARRSSRGGVLDPRCARQALQVPQLLRGREGEPSHRDARFRLPAGERRFEACEATGSFFPALSLYKQLLTRACLQDELGVDPHTFLPGWFGTLFVNTLPWDTTLRCVDLVFFDRTLLFRIALAILDLVRQRLLDPEQSPTRESIIAFLVHLPPTSLSSSLLFPTAFTLKLRDDRIRKAIKRAQGVVRDGAKAAKGGKGRK